MFMPAYCAIVAYCAILAYCAMQAIMCGHIMADGRSPYRNDNTKSP